MSTLLSELVEIDAMHTELMRLEGTHAALKQYGMDRTTLDFLTRANLLASTGLEAYTFSFSDHTALEGLASKIGEGLSNFASKIVSMVKTGADKISNLLGPITGKILDKFKAIPETAWNAMKATGRTIKAHPYKTVAGVLTAALVVAGICAFVASGMPGAYANESAFQSFRYSVIDKIKAIRWPFGKVAVSASDTIIDVKIVGNVGEKVSGTAKTLGWGKEAFAFCVKQVTAIGTKIKEACMSIFSFIGKVTAPIHKPIEKFSAELHSKTEAATGSKYAAMAAVWTAKKYYYQWLFKVIGAIYRMIKAIVLKAFELVRSALFSIHV